MTDRDRDKDRDKEHKLFFIIHCCFLHHMKSFVKIFNRTRCIGKAIILFLNTPFLHEKTDDKLNGIPTHINTQNDTKNHTLKKLHYNLHI